MIRSTYTLEARNELRVGDGGSRSGREGLRRGQREGVRQGLRRRGSGQPGERLGERPVLSAGLDDGLLDGLGLEGQASVPHCLRVEQGYSRCRSPEC